MTDNDPTYLKYRLGTSSLRAYSEHLRQDWQAHYEDVAATVPEDQLLVFDIDWDPPQELCRFVGLPDSRASKFKVANKTVDPLSHAISTLGIRPAVLRRVSRAMPEPAQHGYRR